MQAYVSLTFEIELDIPRTRGPQSETMSNRPALVRSPEFPVSLPTILRNRLHLLLAPLDSFVQFLRHEQSRSMFLLLEDRHVCTIRILRFSVFLGLRIGVANSPGGNETLFERGENRCSGRQ